MAPVQVIVDGSDPNTAGLVMNYVQGVWENWLQQEVVSASSLAVRPAAAPLVVAQPRYWFNPEINSRNFLVPGAVVIIMTLIGTLLTALVVAREWERGTMEALLATPISRAEFLLGKFIPYFVLGMIAMGLAVAAAVFLFGVPFRGSVAALLLVSAAYLATMLPLGLLISTVTGNQFAASQAALVAAFLPALLLSGFIFEIDSMPLDPYPAGALFRFQPADALPCRRRAQRSRSRHAGLDDDRSGVADAARPRYSFAPGVKPWDSGSSCSSSRSYSLPCAIAGAAIS